MKKIKLTQNQFALVDNADYDWLNQHKWFAHKQCSGDFYAVRRVGRAGQQKTIQMHRQILGLERGIKQTDHQNHNTLDNRRDNLRACTNMENQRNRKSARNSSSVYKGVSWRKDIRKWAAYIRIKGELKHLGFFVSEIRAAISYNKAAKKYFGEFAYLNAV